MSALPRCTNQCLLRADFVAEVSNDSCVTAGANFFKELPAIRSLARMVWLHCHRTLHSLCKARLCDRRWSDDQLCETAEVLRDCHGAKARICLGLHRRESAVRGDMQRRGESGQPVKGQRRLGSEARKARTAQESTADLQ